MSIWILGHSLGAARASLYAWSRTFRGLPVDGVYVFGCPRPGNKVLGTALSHVPIWRSIKNELPRTSNPLETDLVTDVPFDIPIINEAYAEIAPFEYCYGQPQPNDPWLAFRYHHIELYAEGCRKLPITGSGAALELLQAVDIIADLYNLTGKWDWQHFVDGQYWGMRVMPNGAKVMVSRGSVTPKDWVDDFNAIQEDVLGARVSSGFWAGIGPIENKLDKALM